MKLAKEEAVSIRVNLYEEVAGRLEEEILFRSFKKHEKLPSEQELAEMFSVSRNVIREALKILKERGLVESRNGIGSYITKPNGNNLSAIISRMIVVDNINYKDIYEMRRILEMAACEKAALSATAMQLQEMEEILEKLKDSSLSIKERRETDFAFHVAIACAAGNPLLASMVEAMRNVFIWMIEKGILVQGGIEDAIVRHAKILAALKEHDPELAKASMYNHLAFSHKIVENYFDGKQKVPTSL